MRLYQKNGGTNFDKLQNTVEGMNSLVTRSHMDGLFCVGAKRAP